MIYLWLKKCLFYDTKCQMAFGSQRIKFSVRVQVRDKSVGSQTCI